MSTFSPSKYDAIILGAGAAGLMCAIEAGKRSKRVVVLEHNERIGKKILISGGGRCNFTNVHCRPENFLSANPHFAKSALARYTPADFVALVAKHRIPYHEKTLGQLFCDRSAHDITTMLEAECGAVGTRIICRARVSDVSHATEFTVRTNAGELRAPALVVATGGLSIPKIGASGFGYDLARQFGLKIVQPRPALVPLLFARDDRETFGELAGVSAEVIARADHHEFREKMLFTHRGLSGPAILQTSLYREGRFPIQVDLSPQQPAVLLEPEHAWTTPEVRKRLRHILPNRLADRWLDYWLAAQRNPVSEKNAWNAELLRAFEHDLHEWVIEPSGDEGYAKAEVTAGGVDTREMSSTTMESRKVPGLYFIGELVDVTGQLGGYNFQWAWASGAAAGRAL
jgi:predicted Rossmann fold flavoprotein